MNCEQPQLNSVDCVKQRRATDARPDKRIELKFVINSSLAGELRDWARSHLQPDPLAAAAVPGSDSYPISTLYLDTPELDLYHRTRDAGRTKHRLRRYGTERRLWLESKKKIKSVVVKRRTCIDEDELSYLRCFPRVVSLENANDQASQTRPDLACDSLDWAGQWFRQKVHDRKLLPSAMVYYERFARIGGLPGDSLRFTIDRGLKGERYHAWDVPATVPDSLRNSVDQEILELKFCSVMPAEFKELLASFPLLATGFSKYRTCLRILQHP